MLLTQKSSQTANQLSIGSKYQLLHWSEALISASRPGDLPCLSTISPSLGNAFTNGDKSFCHLRNPNWSNIATMSGNTISKPDSADNFCFAVSPHLDTNQIFQMAYDISFINSYTFRGRTFVSVLTKSTLSQPVFQNAVVSLSIYEISSIKGNFPVFLATNGIWTDNTLYTKLSSIQLWITYPYSSVTKTPPMSLCLDSVFVLEEYYLNSYLKGQLNIYEKLYADGTKKWYAESLNTFLPAQTYSNFTQAPSSCNFLAYERQSTDTHAGLRLYTYTIASDPSYYSGSVLITSIFTQFGDYQQTPLATLSFRTFSINSSSLWQTSYEVQNSGNLTQNSFQFLSQPLIINWLEVYAPGSKFNLCSIQLFGYGFCEVQSITINNPVTPLRINSNYVISFSTTVVAYYDTYNQYTHSDFCSLGLQIKLSFGTQVYSVKFPVDSNGIVSTQEISVIFNGVSQSATLSLDPRNLKLTFKLNSGIIPINGQSTVPMIWEAFDNRNPNLQSPSTSCTQQFQYACDKIGLETGTFDFQQISSLQDNSTVTYLVGQGIKTIQFSTSIPYCNGYSTTHSNGYYYNLTSGSYFNMSTDTSQFSSCQTQSQDICFFWDQLTYTVSFFSAYGVDQSILLKFQIVFEGTDMYAVNQSVKIDRYINLLILNPKQGCVNTVINYSVLFNHLPYQQNLKFNIYDQAGSTSKIQIDFQDSCTFQNAHQNSLCGSVSDCGLYHYRLTPTVDQTNYQMAQNLQNSGSDMQLLISEDPQSITITINSSAKEFIGFQLSYDLEIGLQNFKIYHSELDPIKQFKIQLTFVAFYPRSQQLSIEYRLGLVNNKVIHPGYVVNPKTYSISDIEVYQIAGQSLQDKYYFDKTSMRFWIGTDNLVFANTSAQFQFKAKLNETPSIINSQFILTVKFIAVPLSTLLALNTPPYFSITNFKPDPVPCFYENKAQNWIYQFPVALDDQFNDIQLQIDCGKALNKSFFIIQKVQKTQFYLSLNYLNDFRQKPAQINCKVTLSDSHNATKDYKIIFQNFCEDAIDNEFVKPNSKFNLTIPKPRISSVSRNGQVTINWNIQMTIPLQNFTAQNYILSQQNTTYTCYNLPPFDVSIQHRQFNKQKLNLNFSLSNISYQINKTQFTILFERPQDISFYLYDSLIVSFNNTDCFQSIQDVNVDYNYTMTKSLPKQLWENVHDVKSWMQVVSQVIVEFAVGVLILSYLLQASLNFLLSLIENISLMLHMFLASLNFPINLLNFLNIFIPLITFSAVPDQYVKQSFEQMFNFSKIKDFAISDQFDAAGYSSIFCVINLGFLYYSIQFGPILLIMLWVCRRYQLLSSLSSVQKFLDNQTKQFFWNGIIMFCSQNYLVISVVSMIGSNDFRFAAAASTTEIYMSVLAVCGIVFSLVFPFIIFYCYRQAIKKGNIKFTRQEIIKIMVKYTVQYENLFTEPYIYHSISYNSFLSSYGALLKDIDIAKTGTFIAVLCPVIDLLVQLILAVTVTRLVNWPKLQIIVFNFILLIYLIFFIYFRPYKQARKQFWKVFDKVVLLILNYHFFLFTDFVIDTDNYAHIANSAIYIICASSLLRFLLELTSTLTELLNITKQKYYSCQQRQAKAKQQKLQLFQIAKSQNQQKKLIQIPNPTPNLYSTKTQSKATDHQGNLNNLNRQKVRFESEVVFTVYNTDEPIRKPRYQKNLQTQSVLKKPLADKLQSLSSYKPLQKTAKIDSKHTNEKRDNHLISAKHKKGIQATKSSKVSQNDRQQEHQRIKPNSLIQNQAFQTQAADNQKQQEQTNFIELRPPIIKKDPWAKDWLELHTKQDYTLEEIKLPETKVEKQNPFANMTQDEIKKCFQLSEHERGRVSIEKLYQNADKNFLSEVSKRNMAEFQKKSQKEKDKITEKYKIVQCDYNDRLEGYLDHQKGSFIVTGYLQPNTPRY